MSRDHIIPKFILKGFKINPNSNDPKVMIYDVGKKNYYIEKIDNAFAIENFNSEKTEKILANDYENYVAKIFQNIKKAVNNNQNKIVLSNKDYKLLFRFFSIMWRRNDIQINYAKSIAKNTENILKKILGNYYEESLKPEFRNITIEEMFERTKKTWQKKLYDKFISDTTDDDETVLKTIKHYIPTIVYNKSKVNFIMHNTYGTLRYIIKKGTEPSYCDVPQIMINPISNNLLFCLTRNEEMLDLDKENYTIKIEEYIDKDFIIDHFIKGYILENTKNIVVDNTNIEIVKQLINKEILY